MSSLAMRSWAAGLVAAGLFWASAGAGEDFQVREIKVGERSVTVVIHRGQSYRRLTVEELPDERLANQLACLEGKLKVADGEGAQIFGSEQRFVLGSADLFKGFVPGDNVWLGGKVERTGNRNSFRVNVAVKLKTDLELFEERFTAAAAAGEWKRLLELADWITRSKDYNPKIGYEEHARYRNCRTRAIRSACSSAEAAFKNDDAAGYAEFAGELLRIGAEPADAHRYLQRAAAINPELQAAVRRLGEAGFVRFQGRWVTKEEKKKLDGQERDRVIQKRNDERDRERRRAEDAVSGAANYVRDVGELEAEVVGLRGREAAGRLASDIERAGDSRLARRALFLAFGLPAELQAEPLAAALRSAEVQTRLAAVELASVRKDLEGRRVVGEAARRDSAEEVAELACRVLAAAADSDSMGRLVELMGSDKEWRVRAAGEALRSVTKEERYTKAEWDLWWGRNKAAYPAGPTQ